MTPTLTFAMLLIVQTLHLLHHRLAKRHISYVEVGASAALCVPLDALPAALLCSIHLLFAGVQVVGSVWIKRLSPEWASASEQASRPRGHEGR